MCLPNDNALAVRRMGVEWWWIARGPGWTAGDLVLRLAL
jgi:hypothetical protein